MQNTQIKFTNKGVIIYGQDKERNLALANEIVVDHICVEGDAEISIECIKEYILSATYPNFMRVSKNSEKNEISVDETREIIRFLSQKPTLQGRKRAIVIEDAENMSSNAANSILKILEELPMDSIILMTANSLQSLIPTIRSRCFKIYIKNQKPSAFDYDDVTMYIKQSLPHIDEKYIYRITDLINSKYRDIISFAKQSTDKQNTARQNTARQNTESVEDFLNILSTYYTYLAIRNEDYSAAQNTLKLQALISQLKTTFLDPQSVIIAASMHSL
ncbi:MAG: hypothetical protein LBI20_01560 [Holosporales bacterium]|jgi:DNA polymerase III delta prime subunit|nr:hypothetical protein [Holosporales bacterium]